MIEDRTTNLLREISVTGTDGGYRLSDGKDTVWKVFEVVHRPSDAARADAGELSAREELPLIWAVPLGGRNRRGSFWAFFPTEYRTSLSGILNAPWKTNEDRQNLLPGVFNNELIEASARLVVSSLPELVDPADPASFLELLPARASDAQLWADELLTNRVYELARSVPSLPDQLGVLKVPATLTLHPADAAGPPFSTWSKCPTRPNAWVHQSVETRERRPRAERLLAPTGPAGLAVWLERLADSGPEGSAYAIRAACKLLTRTSDDLVIGGPTLDWRKEAEVRRAMVVRTSTGIRVADARWRGFPTGSRRPARFRSRIRRSRGVDVRRRARTLEMARHKQDGCGRRAGALSRKSHAKGSGLAAILEPCPGGRSWSCAGVCSAGGERDVAA